MARQCPEEVEIVLSGPSSDFGEGYSGVALLTHDDHFIAVTGVGDLGQVQSHVLKMAGWKQRNSLSVHQNSGIGMQLPRHAVAPAERSETNPHGLVQFKRCSVRRNVGRSDFLDKEQSAGPAANRGPERKWPRRPGKSQPEKDAARVNGVKIHLRKLHHRCCPRDHPCVQRQTGILDPSHR